MDKKLGIKSILPLFITNWIFGIGIIEYPIGTPRPIFSFVYSATLLVGYCTSIIAFRSEIYHVSLISSYFSTPMTTVYYTNIFFVITIVTLGWYRSQGLRRFVAKASVADKSLQQIGIPINHKKMLRCVATQVIIGFLLIVILMSTSSAIVLVGDSPLYVKITMPIVMIFPVLLMFLADAIFTTCVRCARYRFDKLNKLLKSMVTSTKDFPQHKKVCTLMPTMTRHESTLFINDIGIGKNPVVVIKLAKDAHLQLISACEEINNTYGIHLLLSIAIAFAVVTGNMYLCYVTIMNSVIPRFVMLKTLAGSGIWILYYVMKITYFSFVCGCCTRTSNKVGNYINELYDEPFVNEETKLKIRQFNMHLIQKPCKFTAWGFVDMDCRLVQVMIGTITTYLIILIQLGSTPYITAD